MSRHCSCNRALDVGRLTRIIASVNAVNAAKPDLILIAGDFVSGNDSVSASEQVSALAPPPAGWRIGG